MCLKDALSTLFVEHASNIDCFFCTYRRHVLSKRKVVPLPIWKASPETDPEALFPRETVSRSLHIICYFLYNGMSQALVKGHLTLYLTIPTFNDPE